MIKFNKIKPIMIKQLAGIFENLKFGDIFVTKSGKLVKFVTKQPYFYKKDIKTKTMLDLGFFYFDEYIVYYDKNGKHLYSSHGTFANANSKLDIVEKFKMSDLESKTYELLFKLSLIKGDITEISYRNIKSVIKFFEKELQEKEMK